PPYVRHYRMTDEMIDVAQSAMGKAGVSVPRLASSWAYFVVHSAQQLARDGRMALLLPGAILHADYALPILTYLRSRFSSIRLVHVTDRLFEGALEETVVLLAQGFGGCASEQHVYSASTTRLTSMLRGAPVDPIADEEHWKLPLVSVRARELLTAVRHSAIVHPLRAIADIRIGVVTGANSFFVRSAEDEILSLAHAASIGIVASGGHLENPIWRTGDMQRLQRSGTRSRLLMITKKLPKRSRLLRYIRKAEREGIHKGHWCSGRDPWYALNENERPEIFFPYMGSQPMPMSLNLTRATCTNAVHRIWLHSREAADSVVFSSWTSLHYLASEMLGRSYGGGVLKLEPSAAHELPVLDLGKPDIEHLDKISRTQGIEKARDFADRIALRGLLGLSANDVRSIKEAAAVLALRRHQPVRSL
ncbi:MAG: hypothetical protein ACYDA5_10350, partial [Vulcanimicrobiaceae bacterium]